MVFSLIALALLAVAMFFWISHSKTPACTAAPKVVIYDSTAAGAGQAPGPIPKIIWSYWHTGKPPLVVEQCRRNWEKLNPGFAVNLVLGERLMEFVAPRDLPAEFHRLGGVRQSEWMRLYLLHRYGGIWLDASIILTQPLDWMIEAQTAGRAQYLGYYLDRFTARADCPVIDSWCMAAPLGSPFIADWFSEFCGAALTDSPAYIQALGRRREHILQKINSPEYLAVHVAAQKLLNQKQGYRLHLIRAEDSAYFFQTRAGRLKRAGLFPNLLLRKCGDAPPALIKLRGGERRKLEFYLRRRLFTKASIVGRFLDHPPRTAAATTAGNLVK